MVLFLKYLQVAGRVPHDVVRTKLSYICRMFVWELKLQEVKFRHRFQYLFHYFFTRAPRYLAQKTKMDNFKGILLKNKGPKSGSKSSMGV